MEDLTWEEFKKEVDDYLKEVGLNEDIKIWYIDMSYSSKNSLKVSYTPENGLVIF